MSGSSVTLTVAPADVTISDDDTAELSISGPSAQVAEGADAEFTVTLSHSVASDVTVAWSATPGTAETSDYGTATGTARFGAGSAAGSTRTISVVTTDDKLSETSETFSVELGTSITSALSSRVSVKSASSSADAVVSESDPITVSVSGPSSVSEGDAATYTVSLSPTGVTPTQDLTVEYATVDGTASEGSDYTSATGTLRFTQTDHADKTFTVQTTEDTLSEGGEDFTVTLSNLQGGGGPAPGLGDSSAATTIADDDGAPTGITLTVGPDSIAESAAATDVTVTATLNGTSTLPGATVVTLTLGGTATQNTDYTTSALTSVTIPAGRSGGNATLTITPADDSVVEGDETVTVSGTSGTLTVSPADVTITDDDTAELSISGPSAQVAEGRDAEFTVTLSHSVASDVTVAWSATPDTAEASDYGTATGTVTFGAGSAANTTQTVAVQVIDESLSETSETFSVALRTITGDMAGRVSVKTASSTSDAVISESDPITVNVSGPSAVDEGDTTAAYTVSLSPAGVTPTEDLSVSYATAEGTATAGSDYTSVSGTLRFTQAAPDARTLTVQTIEDSVSEGGEDFRVTISGLTGGGGPTPVLGTANATTTITDDDGAPTGITVSVSPSSLAEGAATTTVTVTATLNGTSTLPGPTEVTLTLGGTAGSSDYKSSALSVATIPAGESVATTTLTVTPTQDEVVEGTESIVFSGTAGFLDVSTGLLTITDDDTAELSMAGPSSEVAEGSAAEFSVALSSSVAEEVTVAWAATPGTASISDYAAQTGTVVFAAGTVAGATSGISILVTDDMLSEPAETFSVGLGAVTTTLSPRVTVGTASSSSDVVIAESDPITVSLSGPSTVNEGATSTYTVSLSPTGVMPTQDLTVGYATSDVTAAAGSDYTTKSGTLRFTQADHADKTFTVQTIDDTLSEGGENFAVTISGPSGGGGPLPSLGTSTATTTITDDDAAPTAITLEASLDTISEGATTTTVAVTATLNGTSTLPADTVVTLSLSGTATQNTDYVATNPLPTLTISAGDRSGSTTLTITPTDDSVVEVDESIVVSGTAGTLSVAEDTITISDDDSTEIAISGPGAVSEGSEAVFTVNLSAAVEAEVSVSYATGDVTATAGSDYAARSSAITFTAGSAAGATTTIAIPVTDDDLSEAAESFKVTLGTIGGYLSSRVAVKTASSSADAVILDSDPITVSVSGPSSVNEGATSTYTVSLSPIGVTPTQDLAVSYTTSDVTAVAGSDYVSATGTLTFTQAAAGVQTFTVKTIQDLLSEDDESFTVSISNLQGGGGPAPSLGTATATTTITDDDSHPTGVTLSVSPDSVAEGASSTTVTVTATLNGSSTLPSATMVTLALGGTATPNTDYTSSTLTRVTIPEGQSSVVGTLTVRPIGDSIVEGDESIVISGSAGTLAITPDTITIEDDDSAELSISGPASDVSEGGDAEFMVSLSAAVAAAVSVSYTTGDATATAGSDYTATSSAVTFTADSVAGATTTIAVPVTDDELSEVAETFTVTLGAITSALSSQVSLKSGTGTATATIAASDPITVNLNGPSNVGEGEITGNYTVSLSPNGVIPTADLTVKYTTAHGTASSDDYTTATGTLTFTRADHSEKTFTLQTTEDTLDEPNETFTVSISNPTGGGGPNPTLGTDTVTTTITDDDGTPSSITLSVSPDTVGEDDGATNITVTAMLDGTSTLATSTTVNLTLGGTASSTDDYIVTTVVANIVIAAGQSSGTGRLAITPVDDEVVEGDETITVNGTATGFTVSDADITLTDGAGNTLNDPNNNDVDEAELSVSGPSTAVSEGSDATFTVTLSHSVAADVMVEWSALVGADSAVSSDLATTTGHVTFAANSEVGATTTIDVTTIDDSLSETAESFTVTLGAVISDLSGQVSLDSSASSATATIAASDQITVDLSGPSTVDEGATTAAYTVSLSPQGVIPTAALTVDYATSDGTASSGDFATATGTLTFTQTSHDAQSFTVSTTQDTLYEGDESFTVSISNPRGGGGPMAELGVASATTTITDDEIAPSDIALSVSPGRVSETATTSSFTVTATLEGLSTLTTDTVVTLTLGGTATQNTDYTVTTALASVIIPANSMSATGTLGIDPTHDEIVEGGETIVISGTTTSGLNVSPAPITLLDHSHRREPTSAELSISGPSSSVPEGSDATFTVTLSHSVAADVTVGWSALVDTDSAVSTDLATTTGTVTFAANSASGATTTIDIRTIDDDLSELSETFTVILGAITSTLSDQVSADSSASSTSATIAASDPITVELGGPSSVAEGATTTSYTVSLHPSGVTPTADLTVSYATADGTATAGDDYTATSSTLTFTQAAAGPQTFKVQTTGDNVDESEETFSVTISGPSGGGGPAPSLGTSSVTTTITDDDGTPTSITLSVNPSSIGEDAGQTNIIVMATLDGISTLATSTVVTITLGGSADSSDYAVYTSLTSITISAGQSSATGTLTITPTGDSVVEGNETITVNGSAGSLNVSPATITLTDDDKDTAGDVTRLSWSAGQR